MARTATNMYHLTGLKPNTPMSVIYAERNKWVEVVKPLLLEDATRVNTPQQRWDRQRTIQMIDEAYFNLLTMKQPRHRRSRH
jgi:hypothetical protein